jgi:hypothetical protein
MRVVAFALLLALLAAPAPFAQAKGSSQRCISGVCGQVPNRPTGPTSVLQDPISALTRFQSWMEPLGTILNKVNIKQIFRNIAWAVFGVALLFLCFYLVREGGIFEGFEYVLLRVVVAFALIASSEALGDVWKTAWHEGYKFSTANMSGVYAEAARNLEAVSQRWPSAAIKLQVLNASTKGQSNAAVQVAGTSDNPIFGFFMAVIGPLSGFLYTLLSGFYSFAVMASCLIIVFGKILLPLVGATMAFPGGTGLSHFGTWARYMTIAALAGWFLPLVFGLAAFIAIYVPAQHMQVAFDLVDQITGAAQSAASSVTVTGATLKSPNLVQQALGQLANSWGFSDLKNTIIRLLAAMVVLPFAMCIGLVLAANLVMRATEWLANLVGTVASGAGYQNAAGGAAAKPAMGAAGAVARGASKAAWAGKRLAGAGIRGGVNGLAAGAQAAAAAAAPAARNAVLAGALRAGGGMGWASPPLNLNRGVGTPGVQRQGAAGPVQQGPSHPMTPGQVANNARAYASAQGKFVAGGYHPAPPSRKR